MRLYGAWKLLPLLPWARALLSRRAEAGLASLAASEEGEARQSSDLILEACMQQDQWHRVLLRSRLKGVCMEMCKTVGLYPNCPQCGSGSASAAAGHPGDVAIPGPSTEASTWDSILFHMEQMGQWGRDMIRHWENPEKTSQLQLSARTSANSTLQTEMNASSCVAADATRRKELQGRILATCADICHGPTCKECSQTFAVRETSWSLLMKQVDLLGHAFKRAVQEAREDALDKQEEKLSIFCFAWTPRRDYDENMLAETRKQYRKCDGHIFYTDHAAPGKQKETDFMRVVVPPQSVDRNDDNWLYHRNMVGLMPSWNHLIHSNFVNEHDWFINSELDHFLSPARARQTIAEYLRGLRDGSEEEQASLDGPIMLMWGNAFVFNRKFMQVMKQHWGKLGRTARPGGPGDEAAAVGCPMFMDDTAEWPHSCSQDVVYPHLASVTLPRHFGVTVAKPGSAGCGAGSVNGKHKAYPLGCWELHLNPIHGGQQAALKAIKELAEMNRFKDPKKATEYCQRHKLDAVRNNCMRFWDGRNVPLIHHLHSVSEQQLARQLLDHDSSP
ncbi:unnamed protein product [Symbiodinium sp. CCMP2592]|nr:unnamed protein product [Symbiodinium sp. CCMP2592]